MLDPVVGPDRIAALGYKPVDPSDDLSRFQLAVILTDHTDVDYAKIVAELPIVYDSRGVYRRLGIESERVVAL